MQKENKSARKKHIKFIFNIFSIIVSAMILLYLCVQSNGVAGIVQGFARLKIRWLTLACLCMLCFWLMEALVLFAFSRKLNKKATYLESLKIAMIGQLYSALTPFSSGGQPMQMVEMKQDGFDTASAGSIITIKSIVYQVGLTLYAIISIALNFRSLNSSISHFSLITFSGLLINIVVVSLMIIFAKSRKLTNLIAAGVINFLSKIKIIKNKQASFENAIQSFESFHSSTKQFENDKKNLYFTLVLTMVQFTFYFYITYCIYRGFNLNSAQLSQMIAAQAVVTMISAFIPLPGGSGGAEGSFYLFFGLFFNHATILIAMLIWRIITYYSCILIGSLSVLLNTIFRRQTPVA